MKKAIKYLSRNRKEWWAELLSEFDPNGIYQSKYSDLLEDQ